MWNYVIGVGSLIIGVVSGGLTLYFYYRGKLRKKLSMNWLYHRTINELLVKIRKQQYDDLGRRQYDFDYIIGIDGGGMIIASILQLHLGKPVLYLPAHRGAPQRFPPLSYQHLPSLQGRAVLLVDDASDTGATLREAKEILVKVLGAELVRTAVISKRESLPSRQQQVDIDFFVHGAEHAGDYRDIELPWSVKLG